MAQTTKHHADQVQATVARGSAAKSAVVASWRRSSNFHRLDPAECNLPRRLSQAEFELARQQIEPLVRAAQSNLDRLFLAVGGVGCCVLLADRNGVPVDRRGTASGTRVMARSSYRRRDCYRAQTESGRSETPAGNSPSRSGGRRH